MQLSCHVDIQRLSSSSYLATFSNHYRLYQNTLYLHCTYVHPFRILAFWLMVFVVLTIHDKDFLSYAISVECKENLNIIYESLDASVFVENNRILRPYINHGKICKSSYSILYIESNNHILTNNHMFNYATTMTITCNLIDYWEYHSICMCN